MKPRGRVGRRPPQLCSETEEGLARTAAPRWCPAGGRKTGAGGGAQRPRVGPRASVPRAQEALPSPLPCFPPPVSGERLVGKRRQRKEVSGAEQDREGEWVEELAWFCHGPGMSRARAHVLTALVPGCCTLLRSPRTHRGCYMGLTCQPLPCEKLILREI